MTEDKEELIFQTTNPPSIGKLAEDTGQVNKQFLLTFDQTSPISATFLTGTDYTAYTKIILAGSEVIFTFEDTSTSSVFLFKADLQKLTSMSQITWHYTLTGGTSQIDNFYSSAGFLSDYIIQSMAIVDTITTT